MNQEQNEFESKNGSWWSSDNSQYLENGEYDKFRKEWKLKNQIAPVKIKKHFPLPRTKNEAVIKHNGDVESFSSHDMESREKSPKRKRTLCDSCIDKNDLYAGYCEECEYLKFYGRTQYLKKKKGKKENLTEKMEKMRIQEIRDKDYLIGQQKLKEILKRDGEITPETMPIELHINLPPEPNEFLLHCKYCNGTRDVNKKTQSHNSCSWKRNIKNLWRLTNSPPLFTARGTLIDGKDKEWKRYIAKLNDDLPDDNFSKIHYTKYKSNYFT